ncbi:lasso peptide biosynthesis B2 protein [Streptomyces iconiensis]|uniref:Lasso peptide biosynthesis B2 protein n=1 Tax=Streptomyces iconiensis TaxID=1384038 RepID=A0ABT6ZUZ3_9ACTN|nr:lasso peptide biosynthesis B2 protein [Streptomyces iconiensis]MDJ1132890.1 lasso peptide biosynthesis B2 protein [Streptomyces iconiensis]
MSVNTALPTGTRPALWRRPPIRVAITLAWLLAKQPPRRIRAVLTWVSRGARTATFAEVRRARAGVVALSVSCAGEGCLQRSLATALLCRMRGSWPIWCTGVRTQPFAAHAWVEAEGRPVDEPYPADHYRAIMTVGPRAPRTRP